MYEVNVWISYYIMYCIIDIFNDCKNPEKINYILQ